MTIFAPRSGLERRAQAGVGSRGAGLKSEREIEGEKKGSPKKDVAPPKAPPCGSRNRHANITWEPRTAHLHNHMFLGLRNCDGEPGGDCTSERAILRLRVRVKLVEYPVFVGVCVIRIQRHGGAPQARAVTKVEEAAPL